MSEEGRPFVDPPWEAPLVAEEVLAQIPADAKISGMFFTYLIAAAKAQNFVLPSARDRYLSFNFYPVADLARIVLEAVPLLFPGRPLRHALRTLGRRSPDAFLSSTLGKVTLGSTEGVHAALAAITNAYELNLRPSKVSVLDSGPDWAVVRVDKVFYFLDSHHVGTFEGILKFTGVNGSVRIASRSASSADLLLTWDLGSKPAR
jgi:uncharacterized protein (TIGR02265 family)